MLVAGLFACGKSQGLRVVALMRVEQPCHDNTLAKWIR